MWIANELREDFQFVHTFEMTAAKQKYSMNAGSLVVFLSERFQTKYEAKWQVLEIKVMSRDSALVTACSADIVWCELEPLIDLVLLAAYLDLSFIHLLISGMHHYEYVA